MSFRDDLRKKLPADLFNQLCDALGDDFSFDMVSRSRLNQVIKQRNALREEVELLKSGAQTDDGYDEGSDEGDDLPAKPKKRSPKARSKDATPDAKGLTEAEVQERIATEVQAVKLQYAVLDKLRAKQVVDPDLVYQLLDKSKLQPKADGTLDGLDEQLTAMQTSKPYLFHASATGGDPGAIPAGNNPMGDVFGREGTPNGTGRNSATPDFAGINSVAELMKLSSADQAKFKVTYPEQFQRFISDL